MKALNERRLRENSTDKDFRKNANRCQFNFPKIYIKSIWRNLLCLLLAPFVVSVILGSINFGNIITKSISYLIFIIYFIIMIRCAWYFLKKINNLNLMSDLTAWLLRIGSGLLLIISASMYFSTIVTSFANPDVNMFLYYSLYVWTIVIFILGAFGIWRSLRRYPIIGIWH